MSGEVDRLRQIQGELEQVLEARVTELLARMKAIREVTAHISSVEADIQRQERVRAGLEAELPPLEARHATLSAENADIQARVDGMRDKVARLQKLREELMSNLSGLTGDLKGLGGV